ncbi:hypothetical protein ACFPM0_06645 [Pseudonocardia sulfidoxydans]|uniref:hypothetical protein n=1 Tax=Pseudonocardia sulfidoxydans TaxID=54011 RepID=UPI003608004E
MRPGHRLAALLPALPAPPRAWPERSAEFDTGLARSMIEAVLCRTRQGRTARRTNPAAVRAGRGRRSSRGQPRDIGTPIPGSTWCGPFLPGRTSKSKIAVGM